MAEQQPTKRRRLPVLQAPKVEDAHADRPGWHWSAIVGLGTLFGWLLAEMTVVGPILRGLGAADRSAAAAAVHLAALALPSGAAAALSGRLGARARSAHAIGGAVGLVMLVAGVSFFRVGGGAVWAVASTLAAAAAGAAAAIGYLLGRKRHAPEA